jgi:hypothetical protein
VKDPAFLLWAHVLLVWAIVNYNARDPLQDDTHADSSRWYARITARAVIGTAIVWYLGSTVLLAGIVLIGAVALPLTRRALRASWCAEVEVGANLVFTLSTFAVARDSKTLRALFEVPIANNRIAAACIGAALLLVTIHGGTNIVRGVLKKSGAVPTVHGSLDVKEFNRGRLIGALERVLLFAVVIAGSYEALGFIIAAKGLIRSREFESNRDMTEYFLIGSLASVLIALATGSIAKAVFQAYW